MAKWDVTQFVRPHVLTLTPYASARSEYSGNRGIFLDANENSLGSVTLQSFNRYPDPLQRDLKHQLSILRGTKPENIFIGNGSDEAIDLLIRVFCEPEEDHILILPPTYGMYKVSATINKVEVRSVSLLPNFQIDTQKTLAQIGPGCKLVFICSPNNPTGNLLNETDIHELLKAHNHGLVVVDEAYIDFSSSQGFIPYLEQYPHLVVMQTFSKAWGMAGLRLGAAFAHPDVIDFLNRIKPPYNVNTYTQEKGLEALHHLDKMHQMVKTILEERSRLIHALTQIPIIQKIYPTETNFILVQVHKAEKIYQYLLEKLIIVRNRSKVILCNDCLRITVGSHEENQALIEALESINYEKANIISG